VIKGHILFSDQTTKGTVPFGRGLVRTLLAEYSQAAALTFMAQASADYLGSLLDLQYTPQGQPYIQSGRRPRQLKGMPLPTTQHMQTAG